MEGKNIPLDLFIDSCMTEEMFEVSINCSLDAESTCSSLDAESTCSSLDAESTCSSLDLETQGEEDDVMLEKIISGMGSDHSFITNASLVGVPPSADVVMSEPESSHIDLHKLRPRTSTPIADTSTEEPSYISQDSSYYPSFENHPSFVDSPTPDGKPTGDDHPTRLDDKPPVQTAIVPKHALCLIRTDDVTAFVQQINSAMRCDKCGCKGGIVPTFFNNKGLGGAVTIAYNCMNCQKNPIAFTSAQKYGTTRQTEIGLLVQVACMTAGCTYAQYEKIFGNFLGVSCVHNKKFMGVVEILYPVLKHMLDKVCKVGRDHLKSLDDSQLGSWKRAVLSADGAWHHRGHHSKNGTFSVRDYYTGALLYYMHLCQKGSDTIATEPLYKGTSKSMEGYAAHHVYKKSKEDGLVLEIQWQDADSSSANAIQEIFPDAEIMVCGGHAGRAHRNRLEKFSKKRSVANNEQEVKMYSQTCPEIAEEENQKCHCGTVRHKPGACGCLTAAFIDQAHRNFSCALTTSKLPDELISKLSALAKHACDTHTWVEQVTEDDKPVEKKVSCDFHPLVVCSCNKCPDKYEKDPNCPGKPYKTRNILTCPLHKLLYKHELEYRASLADMYIHPEFGRGHSNWLEASHNVFTRYRSKNVDLHRLHYIVSTNLALLQSNMTFMYQKESVDYHWELDLYRELNLNFPDCLLSQLKEFVLRRRKQLVQKQSDKYKKRRVQLKAQRKQDAEERIRWTKEHGQDTYGDADENMEFDTEVKKEKKMLCKTCGQDDHRTKGSKKCPYFRKKQRAVKKPLSDSHNDSEDSLVSVNSEASPNASFGRDEIYCLCRKGETGAMIECSGKECPFNSWFHFKCVGLAREPEGDWYCPCCSEISSKKRSMDGSSDDAAGVHVPPAKVPKSSLEISPNDLTSASEIIDKSLSVPVIKPSVGVGIVCDLACNTVLLDTTAASESVALKSSKSNPASLNTASSTTRLGEHDSVSRLSTVKSNDPQYRKPKGKNVPMSINECTCGAEGRAHKRHCSLNPSKKGKQEKQEDNADQHCYYNGDSVCVHSIAKKGEHLPCRVVQVVADSYRLACNGGVLNKCFPYAQLTPRSTPLRISIENWHKHPQITLKKARESMEKCTCVLSVASSNHPPIITVSDDQNTATNSEGDQTWTKNAMYTLTIDQRRLVISSTGWLDDSIIYAALVILRNQFPFVNGLQASTLSFNMGFEVAKSDSKYVQILNVDGNHWITVSNVGCSMGEIRIFDSMKGHPHDKTKQLVASLVYSPTPRLKINVMDVCEQQNGSDCGVLAIAYAYELCSALDPCSVSYKKQCIRPHLASCLEVCKFSRFPIHTTHTMTNPVSLSLSVHLCTECRLPVAKECLICSICKRKCHTRCVHMPRCDTNSEWSCNNCSLSV